MTLFPIHNVERVTSRLLFRRLGQLDQFRQFLVDRLAKVRIFLGPLFHVIGISGHQLAAQVGIDDLQSQRESPVSLYCLALIVALQGL